MISSVHMDALVAAVRDLKTQDSFFGPEFFAATIGAILGGLIAAVIQYWSYSEQRRERRIAERKREAANAFSILTKINRAYSTISAIKKQTDNAVIQCIKRGIRLSAAYEAFSGDMPRFSLTADEVEFLRSTKDGDLISAILDLPHIHDMYVDTAALLRGHKVKLAELQSWTNVRPDGSGTSVFEGANASKARLEQFQADKLVAAMIGFTLKDFPETKKLLQDSQAKFVSIIGKDDMGVVWDIGENP